LPLPAATASRWSELSAEIDDALMRDDVSEPVTHRAYATSLNVITPTRRECLGPGTIPHRPAES